MTQSICLLSVKNGKKKNNQEETAGVPLRFSCLIYALTITHTPCCALFAAA